MKLHELLLFSRYLQLAPAHHIIPYSIKSIYKRSCLVSKYQFRVQKWILSFKIIHTRNDYFSSGKRSSCTKSPKRRAIILDTKLRFHLMNNSLSQFGLCDQHRPSQRKDFRSCGVSVWCTSRIGQRQVCTRASSTLRSLLRESTSWHRFPLGLFLKTFYSDHYCSSTQINSATYAMKTLLWCSVHPRLGALESTGTSWCCLIKLCWRALLELLALWRLSGFSSDTVDSASIKFV